MGLGFVATTAVEMRRGGDALVSVVRPSSDDVVCPKPRQIGLCNCPPRDLFRPSPLLLNNQQIEACDAKAGNELFDIILNKGAYRAEKPYFQVALSPPYFNGSPPSRASNPVIQDKQFGNSTLSPSTPAFELSASPSSPLHNTWGGGGCVRTKYGHIPDPVRIEGFKCCNSYSSISTIA